MHLVQKMDNSWVSLPDLKFDIKEFVGLPEIIDDEMALEEPLTKFELLLRSVLEKRDRSCVNRFQLCSALEGGWPCTQAIADCIGDVIKLGPRECLLKMGSCENLNLNTDVIFTCASLIYLQLQLRLSSEFHPLVAIEPNSVNLRCLKTLNLANVILSDDSLKKLLLGCPVLEELVVEGCYIDIIEIYSNTLKKLVLCSSYYIMRLQISTPNLVYLDIHVWGIEEIMLLNMPSLVDASIYINGWYDLDEYVTMGPKLIHSLSNVECLQLEFNYPDGEVPKKECSDFPVFNNLKRLKLLDWRVCGFNLAPYFLLHSPKLQELTIADSLPCSMKYLDKEITQAEPEDALVQQEFLKKVKIVGFKNDNGFVDQLINKLVVDVKIIGEIDIV